MIPLFRSNLPRRRKKKPMKMGASLFTQRRWANMPKRQKTFNRMLLPDRDGDRVPDLFDCQPFNRKKQEFKKWRTRAGRKEVEDMTAAERFGRKNVLRMKKLGEGYGRNVYALDKDKVLKVAKNPGGIRQNLYERDLDNVLDYVKHYESGKDYVVMEKAEPIKSEKVKKFIKGLSDVKQYNPNRPGRATDEQYRYLEKEGHGDLMNFSVSSGDIRRKTNWAEKEGEPVLIDGGTLNEEALEEPHKVEDMRNYVRKGEYWGKPLSDNQKKYWDMQVKEWDEIERQRKVFQKKGEKDEVVEKAKEEFKDFEEQPEALQALEEKSDDLDDDISDTELKPEENTL